MSSYFTEIKFDIVKIFKAISKNKIKKMEIQWKKTKV